MVWIKENAVTRSARSSEMSNNYTAESPTTFEDEQTLSNNNKV